jgi:hypothetical protein
MTEDRTSHADPGVSAPKADKAHVFQEVDVLPMATPSNTLEVGLGPYATPPTPIIKSQVCGLCRKPRMDRVHIEGEAEADAESPNWG